ncbi:MAG TPA: sigma-70 family RNA polymerase sigma factor [Solirubrobacterales bacterium]|nr:sigma-70 family RNA polymerase sigma factor [Solirubrobacterales bacterium]
MASQAEREQAGRRGPILERALDEARAALRRQALRHSPGEAEAEEAVQEACLDFLRAYDGPAGVAAVRWLQVAVKHRAWEIGRRQRAQCARTVPDGSDDLEWLLAGDQADPGERAERAEAVAQFFGALAQLKPDERIALLLLGLGCSYREIEQLQGWTRTKVNRCLSEGRATLRGLGQ